MKQLPSLVLLCGMVLALLLLTPLDSAAEEALAPEGAALYASYCADCHKPLGKSTKAGRSLVRVRSAIRHFAIMNHLKVLSDAELQAIVQALAIPRGN
ncbi:hypothetical protein DSOUD_3499 [Desulfuromonas soudanensis]|uniref:Cytochrome c domain-containing protein n=1 Tax=Desulfuromonas soudanensis TaxID=1603606 RepID=A0A0M3QGQ5_9BACT|nr:cytochrome c [Desulfuromonas soudanensis]ALC18213.1 hypothetical protein DSOUD_3499 [Desulfuromonas soudanensis]